MSKHILKDLSPINNNEYLLEKEFEFFKKYYSIYKNVENGQVVLTKKEYSNIFSQSNYWDKLYIFKEAFNSKYHFFSDKLYEIYILKLMKA